MYKQFKIGFLLLFFFIGFTGLLYPITVTLIAQSFFKTQANGSLIKIEDKYVGSYLIGQNFTLDKYFWGRPSSTPIYPYNALASCASNMEINHPRLLANINNRMLKLNGYKSDVNLIPIDLLTSSGSGLDPHISLEAAFYQIKRVANARNISEDKIKTLVLKLIEKRTFNILGEPRINVLNLNIALDQLQV